MRANVTAEGVRTDQKTSRAALSNRTLSGSATSPIPGGQRVGGRDGLAVLRSTHQSRECSTCLRVVDRTGHPASLRQGGSSNKRAPRLPRPSCRRIDRPEVGLRKRNQYLAHDEKYIRRISMAARRSVPTHPPRPSCGRTAVRPYTADGRPTARIGNVHRPDALSSVRARNHGQAQQAGRDGVK
jgi:hypothetical protein